MEELGGTDTMNVLLENVIKDRYRISTVKIEHLRSSCAYEAALDLAYREQWIALEDLLVKLQIIRTANSRRVNDRRPSA